VDVSVPLLATQAEDVQALGWNSGTDCFTHAVQDCLQLEVLLATEVASDTFTMFLRRDKHVPVQRWVLVQEGDRLVVLVDDVVREVRVAGNKLADEAAIAELRSDRAEVDVAPLHVRSLPNMERRPLPGTELEITPVGVGTAPIGSGRDWPVWWGPQDETESIRAIHLALDLGVNWVDTAPFYGWGRAEEVVGRALDGRRDDVLVFTKCGTFPDERGSRMDLRPQSIRAEVEESLRRLRTDRLDLLQLHDEDPNTPIEESWGEVQRLIEEGRVRHGGISNHRAGEVERALAVGPIGALQYQYSLLFRHHEQDILPLAEREGIGVLAWSPLAAGFLAAAFDLEQLVEDDFRRRHPFAQLDLEPLRATLRAVGESHGASAAQVALAWLIAQPAVTGAIVGIRNEREAEELPGAGGLTLGADELREIAAAAA
jgi:aryl-alcohol dehydrogenase-like predicted oxidoreductase